MKRINIQKDIESRRNIEQEIPLVSEDKSSVEPIITQPNAESETIPEPENNESSRQDEKPKKRGRASKGNV